MYYWVSYKLQKLYLYMKYVPLWHVVVGIVVSKLMDELPFVLHGQLPPGDAIIHCISPLCFAWPIAPLAIP